MKDTMNEETCQRCGEQGPDLRTLWMACLYEMSEIGLPFELVSNGDRKFYTLRVCKDCRASWMQAIQSWFQNPEDNSDPVGSGLYVRKLGANVEVQKIQGRS